MTDKGYTVSEVRESTWASTRLNEPWAVYSSRGDLSILTLSQVLELAGSYELGREPAGRDLPDQVQKWMKHPTLALASIYALEKATLSLSRDQRLNMLTRWFNSGGGLPAESRKPGKKGTKLSLGHPALFNQFLRWVVRYLALHESIDGRVDRDCERMINLARELQDKAPVRCY